MVLPISLSLSRHLVEILANQTGSLRRCRTFELFSGAEFSNLLQSAVPSVLTPSDMLAVPFYGQFIDAERFTYIDSRLSIESITDV